MCPTCLHGACTEHAWAAAWRPHGHGGKDGGEADGACTVGDWEALLPAQHATERRAGAPVGAMVAGAAAGGTGGQAIVAAAVDVLIGFGAKTGAGRRRWGHGNTPPLWRSTSRE